MKKISIEKDDLSDGKVAELLREHHQEMFLYSPAESIHALDLTHLNDSDLTFWRAECDGIFAGCGAIKALSHQHAEIKSMRTVKSFLRQGVAARILEELLKEASARGYQQVSLETGTHQAFAPAIALYKKFGFKVCGPFGDYQEDPYSMFMTVELG